MESLAEDFKLSACGRQPSSFDSLSFDLVVWFLFLLCFLGQVSAIQVWGACSYITPDLCRPFGIVFLATLRIMFHFSLGVG
jgi:hypothetical protein